MSYNIRVYKYPSGWQYRVYSPITGFPDNKHHVLNPDQNVRDEIYWDFNEQCWNHIECDPDKMWYNIFTMEFEPMPKLIKEPDPERSAKVSMNRTVNKVYHLSRSNVWEWFFTLTFNPEKVDSFDFDACQKKLTKWLDHLHRTAPDMKYMVVPEQHKSGRYHFHGLFAHMEGVSFINSGHTTKDGDVIFNIGNYTLGWSTATRVKDNAKVTKYITKYISKDMCASTKNRKRYWRSRNLNDVEPEEMTLTPQQMKNMLEILKDNCIYSKEVKTEFLNVTYFEMENENAKQ